MLREGWYLMDVADVERLLAQHRGEGSGPLNAQELSIDQALAYRDAGNLPDDQGRTLRLVLHIDGEAAVDVKRLRFEPDVHERPAWRIEGSRPVNVLPLRTTPKQPAPETWWEDEEMAALEDEWRATGRVGDVVIPGEYRSFLFKTIAGLRMAGRDVTPATLADSVSRWLQPADAERIGSALREANAREGRG